MKKIKQNKKLLFIILILVVTLSYCSFHTFISNDDFPYSFFYRGPLRITNIIQVVKNQVADYFHINGRFFVHIIVQTLLIFNKNAWSILNPIVIAILLYIITKITTNIKENIEASKIPYIYATSAILFLIMIEYKYIIYWVAGSVNYIWVSLTQLLFIYYYLKEGLNKKYLLNAFIILAVSILHEMSLVLLIIIVIGSFILNKINKKSTDKKYFLYVVALILSGAFILLSPGNSNRMAANEVWNNMNLIEKIFTSLPVVSKNLFNLRNIYNIIPAIYLISIIYANIKIKNKISLTLSLSLLIISLLCLIIDNSIIYIILSIISFISLAYPCIYYKNYSLIITTLGFYAMVFSTIITPNYADGRPNLFFDIYSIIIILVSLSDLISSKTAKTIILSIIAITLVHEVYIYYSLSIYHKSRLANIEECRINKCQTLNLKLIPSKYQKYHIDINSPKDKEYYTYQYFIQYYSLPENIEINYYE